MPRFGADGSVAEVRAVGEPKKTTVRLRDADQRNIARMIRTGVAQNESEAIRVALAEYGRISSRLDAVERAMSVDAIALGLALGGKRIPLEQAEPLRRELVRRANAGDAIAAEYVKAGADMLGVFWDGKRWVEQVDSGRGPGVAVGRSGVVQTRRTR